MIELDKRIIEGKKPLTAFDEVDSKFIGTDCYFSNKASDFMDVSKYCQIGTLLHKDETTGVFSATKNNSYAVFDYCLPADWVKEPEKKYRPYTVLQFSHDIQTEKLGEFITFRRKADRVHDIYIVRYNGVFTENKVDYACLGAKAYSMKELFEEYELKKDGQWMPFGIEE